MIYRVGLENNNEDRTIAWALEHPGCFAYGKDADAAQQNFPQAAREYSAWIARRGGSWLEGDVQVVVEEVFDVRFIRPTFDFDERGDGTYMVESFFLYDWKPLQAQEIERALQMLNWSRDDLLDLVHNLTPEKLAQSVPEERWDIGGILKHIAGGEWFYQERIGYPFPEQEDDLPSDPFERLQMVREHFNALLPRLEGVQKVIGQEGEIWSPRKMLRRALWHERDHTEHIRKLL